MHSLGEQWFDHRLATVVSAGGGRRMAALPRDRHRGHRLVCGGCSMVLAWD